MLTERKPIAAICKKGAAKGSRHRDEDEICNINHLSVSRNSGPLSPAGFIIRCTALDTGNSRLSIRKDNDALREGFARHPSDEILTADSRRDPSLKWALRAEVAEPGGNVG